MICLDPLATFGAYFVRLKWVVCPVMAFLFWKQGNWVGAALALPLAARRSSLSICCNHPSGRALRGKRLYASAPQSHWHTTTMICAMRLDGSTACMTIEGATDTEVFQVFVRQVLCPTLRPGDLVIMDNLPPHKSTETLSLIQQLGAEVLFLPAYSPDLNPIEKMWSKLKEFLRSAEARSQASLTQAIASALETITAQDGINWFASCGYSFL